MIRWTVEPYTLAIIGRLMASSSPLFYSEESAQWWLRHEAATGPDLLLY